MANITKQSLECKLVVEMSPCSSEPDQRRASGHLVHPTVPSATKLPSPSLVAHIPSDAAMLAYGTPLKSSTNVGSHKTTPRRGPQCSSAVTARPASTLEQPSPPVAQCPHRSQAREHVSHQSTGGPPPTPIVVSEVLCFIQNFALRCSKVTLVSVLSGFYTTEEIITAKNRLYEFAQTVQPKLAGLENKKRKGAQKRTRDTEDIIDLFLLLDGLNVPMPRYGAAKIDRFVPVLKS